MRTFDTGATRNADDNRLDYEGFLHPAVLKAFSEHMHVNRRQADGQLRDSDNWQKGIPKDAYMKSMWRHFHEVWQLHRDTGTADISALSALLFNVMGYMFEELVETGEATRPDRESLPAQSAEVPKAPFQFQVGDTVKIGKVDPNWEFRAHHLEGTEGRTGTVLALDEVNGDAFVGLSVHGSWFYPVESLQLVERAR